MAINGFQQYKDQSVYTMTQGELLLLLYDELVKRLVRASLELDKKLYREFESTVDRATDIVRYLDRTLDRKYSIAMELHRLYDFMLYDLSRVKLGRNRTELERVTHMSRELREAFQTAQKDNDSGK